MKYFKLHNSINLKEVGKTPQSEEGYIGDIQKDFIPFEGEIEAKFELPIPMLVDKAKQTSLLNIVMIPSWFLILDDLFLSFIKKFNIGSHQSWKLKVTQKDSIIEKYNLFIINDVKQTKYIDFTKSIFYKGKHFEHTTNREVIEIINFKDYLDKRSYIKKEKNGFYLLHEKVVFNLREAQEDMFRIINSPEGGYYVSEKLKDAILEEGFTGIDFIEMSQLNNVEVIY